MRPSIRKLTIAAKTFGLLLAVLTPPAMAVAHLGLSLHGIERMHAREAARPGAHLESVGHYDTAEEVASTGREEGVRFRTVTVRRD